MRVSAHAFRFEVSIAVEPWRGAAAPEGRAVLGRTGPARAEGDLAFLDDHMRADIGLAPDQGPRPRERDRPDWVRLWCDAGV